METFEFKRPGGSIDEAHLYEPRVVQGTEEQIGVKVPDGKFYFFLDGESFSLDKEGLGRKPYIIKKNGERTNIEEWLKEISEEREKASLWSYDKTKKIIISPEGKEYKTVVDLPEESLKNVAIAIRSTVGDDASTWPSDIAEAITTRFLSVRRKQK